MDEDHRSLLHSRAVAQPFGTYTRLLRLENPARKELPKLGISCSFSLDQVQETISSGDPSFRELAGPEWRFVELPTGHWPTGALDLLTACGGALLQPPFE